MNTLAPSFLNQSSSFLQVTRTCMKAWMSSNFGQITDTNTRVICPCASEKLLYNIVSTLAPSFLIGSSSYLQVTRTSITSRTSSKFGQIGQRTAELAALERLEKSPYTYNGRNLVNTLKPSFLIGSSSFLQVSRTCMKAWMSSNFSKFATELRHLIDVRI